MGIVDTICVGLNGWISFIPCLLTLPVFLPGVLSGVVCYRLLWPRFQNVPPLWKFKVMLLSGVILWLCSQNRKADKALDGDPRFGPTKGRTPFQSLISIIDKLWFTWGLNNFFWIRLGFMISLIFSNLSLNSFKTMKKPIKNFPFQRPGFLSFVQYEVDAGFGLANKMGWFINQLLQTKFGRKWFEKSTFVIFTLFLLPFWRTTVEVICYDYTVWVFGRHAG